jgi:hypothetical protein
VSEKWMATENMEKEKGRRSMQASLHSNPLYSKLSIALRTLPSLPVPGGCGGVGHWRVEAVALLAITKHCYVGHVEDGHHHHHHQAAGGPGR